MFINILCTIVMRQHQLIMHRELIQILSVHVFQLPHYMYFHGLVALQLRRTLRSAFSELTVE